MNNLANLQPPLTRFVRETACCPLFTACRTMDQLKDY